MYSTDLANFTGNTSAAIERVQGGMLCAWDDAAETDAGDILMQLTPYVLGVSEAWWSPQETTSGTDVPEARAHVHRCRMVARGLPSHPIFGVPYSTAFCAREAEANIPVWGPPE
jgi:hexosaminidase